MVADAAPWLRDWALPQDLSWPINNVNSKTRNFSLGVASSYCILFFGYGYQILITISYRGRGGGGRGAVAQGLGAAAGSFMANQQRDFEDEELFTRGRKFVLHSLFWLWLPDPHHEHLIGDGVVADAAPWLRDWALPQDLSWPINNVNSKTRSSSLGVASSYCILFWS